MKGTCEECGMESVNHDLEKFSVGVDSVFRKIFRPIDPVVRIIRPLADKVIDLTLPPLSSFFFKTGIAKKLTEPDEKSSETAQALWEEARKRGIDMYEMRLFGLPRRSFIAKHGGRSIAFEGLPRPSRIQKSILWIDDKSEVKNRFHKAGFPVAKGRSVGSEKEALKVFRELEKPVIAKPQEGSAGRHTTVHIETEEELITAYRNANLVSPEVMIEEELLGPVFRATLINKKLVAVLRRDPPQVSGDGKSTLRDLVNKENQNPLRRGPVFAEINIDSVVSKREMHRQGLNPDSILPAGESALFHFKVNWGVGGTSRDATSEIHRDNVKLFEDIGRYLGEDIVGIDFITRDISKSWKETPRSGVIECNSLPLIGNHHFPYEGPVKNVAGAIWDMALPSSRV